MYLESLRLIQFKNYKKTELSFSPQINCFLGSNGSGKTNLLDAIYFLSFTKSAEQTQDAQCMQHETDFFSLQGKYALTDKTKTVFCAFQQGKKKQIKLDEKAYQRHAEHIGRFPAVLIAPNDTDVIRGGSEDRRRFFDGIIAQANKAYLNDLMAYQRVLKQRNRLLKQFAENETFDAALLETYTDQLISLGGHIYEARKSFLKDFEPLLIEHYATLSDEQEPIGITYESHHAGDIRQAFADSLQKDRILKRTNRGIHRDEFHFEMKERLIKNYGSQGQQKSYLIALKMANFHYLKTQMEVKPLLLLDDIFDKLDDQRIEKLLAMVASDAFGQIFITDARPERSKTHFGKLQQKHRFFRVVNGCVEEEKES